MSSPPIRSRQTSTPGIDYAAHALDPEGHCIQLYYFMEQIGWDGKPRPKEIRRKVSAEWPEVLEPLSDICADQTFKGPSDKARHNFERQHSGLDDLAD